MFSESLSSKISGARWRLPVDWVGAGFMFESKVDEMAIGDTFRPAQKRD
jgi:hypothetical protein